MRNSPKTRVRVVIDVTNFGLRAQHPPGPSLPPSPRQPWCMARPHTGLLLSRGGGGIAVRGSPIQLRKVAEKLREIAGKLRKIAGKLREIVVL